MAWLKRLTRPLSTKLTRAPLERFVRAHAGPGRTLDLGAQNGPYGAWFPDRVALDVRPGAGVQVIGDAQALPFAAETFDRVLCTEVLEHLPEPQRAIDEMRRVLTPGGELLLTTRFLFPIHDAPNDYFRFTKFGLRHLLRAFEIVSLDAEATSVGTLAVLLQRVGAQTETLGHPSLRAGWLVAAQCVRPFAWLITREFGDSRRRNVETGVITSGYYVVARRPADSPRPPR